MTDMKKILLATTALVFALSSCDHEPYFEGLGDQRPTNIINEQVEYTGVYPEGGCFTDNAPSDKSIIPFLNIQYKIADPGSKLVVSYKYGKLERKLTDHMVDFNRETTFKKKFAMDGWYNITTKGTTYWYDNINKAGEASSVKPECRIQGADKASTGGEAWLISPRYAIKKNIMNVYLSNGYPEGATFKIYVSKNFDGTNFFKSDGTTVDMSLWIDITAKVAIPEDKVGGWSNGDSGDVSLDEYVGEKLSFAFVYSASANTDGTYQLDNFNVPLFKDVIESIVTRQDEYLFNDANKGWEFSRVVPNYLLNEKFDESIGEFTNWDVTLPEGVLSIWTWDKNKYMKASAYKGGNLSGEGWLISPVMDASDRTEILLTFDHAARYFADATKELTVWYSLDYDAADKESATWEPIAVTTYPSGKDWTFVSAKIDMAPYIAGKKNVRIAFKYVSSTDAAATWEIKNVLME